MKTNRKLRPQPSLAPLSTDEYHQLGEMLRARTYEDVRQQIAKPRAEGGFDLHISVKPLQVLHHRVNELDRINLRIAAGEKLTLTAYDEIQAGTVPLTEQIHRAILHATHDRVLEHDNSPHQLLALQRLADFPARAEIRDSREQLHREQWAHKLDMDAFHKHIATKRADLAEKSLHLREQIAHSRLAPDLYPDPCAEARHFFGAPASSSRWGEGAPEPTSTPATELDPIAYPSANSLPSTQNHGRDVERVSAQANISSEVFHPRPTSTSRDATHPHQAHATELSHPLSQQGRGLGEGFSTASNISTSPDQKTSNEADQENPSVSSVPFPVPRSGKSFISSGLCSLCNSFPSPSTDSTNRDLSSSPSSPTQNPSPSASSATSALIPFSSPFHLPFPSTLPPAVIANNILYQQKIEAGEIIPISIPGELARVDYSNPADRHYFVSREKSGTARYVPDPNAATRKWLPALRSFGPHSLTSTATENPAPVNDASSNPDTGHSAEDILPSLKSQISNLQSSRSVSSAISASSALNPSPADQTSPIAVA